MPLRSWLSRASAIAGAEELHVTREEWREVAESVAASGGRLLAIWASHHISGDVIRAAFIADTGILVASLPVTENGYPSIGNSFPCAVRMER
ncbi:MAG TPA: hypothetical protein VET48_08880, partial [Steroidobacteraceae bacterium]|nr:hypothetical protein [Steroidobacteraceae bacterium]